MSGKFGPVPTVANVGVQTNGVAPNRALYVQFNEAMDASTINNQTVMVTEAGGTGVPGTVSYNSTFDVAAFQPNPALQENAQYTLKVTTGVASSQGSHPLSTFAQTFTTRAETDSSPIGVKTVTPFPGQSCVSTTMTISITFTEGADINTLNSSNIMISGPGGVPISAAISYNVATAMVTLTPNAPLPSGSITVWVGNVADAAGQKMTSPFTWSFLTTCGSSGGGGTPGNIQYQAPLMRGNTLNAVKGQVTVDTMGNTTVGLTGATANASYYVRFCPAADVFQTSKSSSCFVVIPQISTDGSGNASATGKFPKSGNWAGDFNLVDSAGNTVYQTYLAPQVNNQTYLATLLPETNTNGGADTTVSSQDPLSSGTVTYGNGALKVVVQGAAASSTYSTTETSTLGLDGPNTYELSQFTTDAKGNGSSTTALETAGGDLFQVLPPQSGGFIGGFSVP
ncbi:MAG: Ig-like domain-containing protein [Acidobacteriota bacterium]